MMKLKQGFTLLELMVAILIISILAAISGPIYKSYVTKSEFADVLQELTQYQDQMLGAYQVNDYFPSTFANLTAGSYTAITSDVLQAVYYNVSTNADAAYLKGLTLDIGVSGYVAAASDGSGGTNCTVTVAAVPTATGYLQTYCGQWDGSSADVPLTALPSSCQDTNISALIS